MDSPISNMMEKQIKTVDLDDTVEQVEQILKDNRQITLAVVDHVVDEVIGLIGVRDLARFHFEKRDPKLVRAWEICSYKPLQVNSDMATSIVAQMMISKSIHHVLVTDKKKIVGIVSSLDFVKRVMRESL
jgi:CBS domain-containing protein